MDFSKTIVAMRKSAGLTQVELAKRAGVGLRFVRELEQGKRTVRLDKVNQVLGLFGCEVAIQNIAKRGEVADGS
jgi:y4mF family transcriptional regulator